MLHAWLRGCRGRGLAPCQGCKIPSPSSPLEEGKVSPVVLGPCQVEELKKKDPVVLGVFKSASDAAFKAYEAAAGALFSDFDFGHTFDASLISEVRQEVRQQANCALRCLYGMPARPASAGQALLGLR